MIDLSFTKNEVMTLLDAVAMATELETQKLESLLRTGAHAQGFANAVVARETHLRELARLAKKLRP